MPGVRTVWRHSIESRPCDHCGKEFKPRSDFIRKGRGGRFCSRLCSQTWESLRKPNQDEKFWSKVKILSEDECWNFQCFLKGGYGYLRVDNKMVAAHRYAYTSRKGPIVDNLMVLHSCDNPSCCNPNHLSLGTGAENMRQMAERKRSGAPKGGNHYRAKLTDETAIKILKEYDKELGNKYFAKKYNVSSCIITHLIHGNTFKHLKRENE